MAQDARRVAYRELARLHPPRVVLEVGVDRGDDLRWLRDAVGMEAVIYGIDLVDRVAGKNRDAFWLIVGDSVEVAKWLPWSKDSMSPFATSNQLDWLLIDGDHSEMGIRRDLAAWLPYLRHGGLLGLHDVLIAGDPSCVWPRLIWKELQSDARFSNAKLWRDWCGFGVLTYR